MSPPFTDLSGNQNVFITSVVTCPPERCTNKHEVANIHFTFNTKHDSLQTKVTLVFN